MKEYEIGKEFEGMVNGKEMLLKVVEDDTREPICSGCIFDITGICCICDTCSKGERKDRKNVHFVEVV